MRELNQRLFSCVQIIKRNFTLLVAESVWQFKGYLWRKVHSQSVALVKFASTVNVARWTERQICSLTTDSVSLYAERRMESRLAFTLTTVCIECNDIQRIGAMA